MTSLVADRFEIRQLAGQGGIATVFRAVDSMSGQMVALKIVPSTFSIAHFEREAVLLSRLSDESIVGYVAHGRLSDGRMYLAMEWLEGESLDHRLARGPLSVRESIAVARRVARALAAGHALGIVHRDVKPANIILRNSEASAAVLVDFGVARTLGAAPSAMIGTPQYMAPEQARGEGAVDGRADVFSLGCVLFECLTGRPAFAGAQIVAVLAKVLLEPAPRVPTVPALADLVAAMMAKDVAKRPPSVAGALERIDESEAPERVEPTTPVLTAVLLARAADGTLVAHDGVPESMARRALQLPECVVAIGTGTAVGQAIDRAAALLEAHAGEVGIWLDDASAVIVEPGFEISRNPSGIVLLAEGSG